jgi:glycosyltransferase involved in cell wall biosynthesis
MGRNAAGESFLRGLIGHGRGERFWVQVANRAHAGAFAEIMDSAGVKKPVQVVERHTLGALAEPGALYLPGPGLGEHAWQRSLATANSGASGWSLCGITHTTASARAMDSIVELLTAPVQAWDALICTSVAVKDNVERLLSAQAEHLRRRLGACQFVTPRLPVIPLGIHTADFRFSEAARAAARHRIGAAGDTLVVLYTGRLSFHAKAHPLAMYQALEIAAHRLPSGQKLVLVECGWHANEFIENAFAEAARLACPSVRTVLLDGRLAESRNTAWACADVFCSLSDNIQETFGIVPIEAMAAGLPVVVSDWDGYKDTVRHGVDGFRVPTLMPAAGLGADMAYRHALEIDNYDVYCGNACSVVAVDVGKAAESFSSLFASAELRQQMGAAGRQRAHEDYDWACIIPQYEALWQELGEMRRHAAPVPVAGALAWPARMDPFAAFAAYPTATLGPETLLALAADDPGELKSRIESFGKLAMVSYASLTMMSPEEIDAVLNSASQGVRPARELLQDIQPPRRAHVLRGLAMLAKLGIFVTVTPDQ